MQTLDYLITSLLVWLLIMSAAKMLGKVSAMAAALPLVVIVSGVIGIVLVENGFGALELLKLFFKLIYGATGA